MTPLPVQEPRLLGIAKTLPAIDLPTREGVVSVNDRACLGINASPEA